MTEPLAPEADRFQAGFTRAARGVRARLSLGRVLAGAAAGMALGALACAAAWQTRHGELRPWAAAAGAVGAAAGLGLSRRRRLSDTDVALYLDAKLGSEEAISTAIELETRRRDDPARAVVISQAAETLAHASPSAIRTRMWHPVHLTIPVAAAAIAYLSWIPLPPAPPSVAAPPGAATVQIAEIAGLEKVIRLAEIDARDEAQRQRLKQIAEDAKKLREKLRQGVEKRQAQADISKLKDAIVAERLSLGDGEQRQGLESALGKLGENPDLKNAAKALGDRDLVQFDEEMEKLANKLEQTDRERAKKTLEEAAEAAKKAGAPDVARELAEQKKRMEERAKKAEKLRELADAIGDGLSDDAKDALKDFNGSGSDKDAQKLAEKLADALDKLTPEQQKNLAEHLKRQMAQQGGEPNSAPPSKQQLEDLLDQLSTPEGQKQLEEELKRLAEAPAPGSPEAQRQGALDDAQRGMGEAEGQLGAPMPVPVAGGNNRPGKGGEDKGGNPSGNAQPGHSEGGGPGNHRGQTGVVDGKGVQARATTKVNQGRPMPGIVMGRTAARPGETANVQGTGALGAAGPGEVGAIERSDVPEEYREQVGRYFQPK
jgi:hypothetical protein